MNKIPFILLTTGLSVWAGTSQFDAMGRSLGKKQAKNPGIVAYDKASAVASEKKNSLNTPAPLAKTYTPVHVEKIWGHYKSKSNSYALNGVSRGEARYLHLVDSLERKDWPRNQFFPINNFDNTGDLYNGAADYPNNNGGECEVRNAPANQHYYTYYASALPSIGMSFDQNTKHVKYEGDYAGADGSGIKIFNVVGDKPITLKNGSCRNSVSRVYTGGIQHYYVKRLINVISKNADVSTTSDEGNARINNRFTNHPLFPYSLNLYIGNVISTSADGTLYNGEAAVIDDYIYNNRVIEFVPYLAGGVKTGAGASLNAISVAPVNAARHTINPVVPTPRFLERTNVNSHYAKPEIYNVSYILDENNSGTERIFHDNIAHFMGVQDSWGAASTSAAMTANLLTVRPFYRWHPEVVKALWLTANQRTPLYRVDTPNLYGDYTNRCGKSNCLTTIANKRLATMKHLLNNNVSRYWYGNNQDFFANNEPISFYENVESGKSYNVAIAWLVRGDYALTERNISANYTFKIINDNTGKVILNSSVDLATFRYGEFTVPEGVTRIRVEITRSRDRGDRIILGYNLHKVS